MSDLISRQAAAKAVDWDSEAYLTILNLPTIDPVKHGRWIKDDVGVHCSECFCGWEFLTGIPVEVYGFHYCPNCGAKMDGGEDGK